jgi:hypothetical protein
MAEGNIEYPGGWVAREFELNRYVREFAHFLFMTSVTRFPLGTFI